MNPLAELEAALKDDEKIVIDDETGYIMVLKADDRWLFALAPVDGCWCLYHVGMSIGPNYLSGLVRTIEALNLRDFGVARPL